MWLPDWRVVFNQEQEPWNLFSPSWREAQAEGEGSAPPSGKGNSLFQQQAGTGCTGWGCAPAAPLCPGTQSKHLREAGPRILQRLGPTPSRSPLQPPGWVRYQNTLEPRLQTRGKELARTRSAWESGIQPRSARLGAEPLPCCQL